MRKEIWIDLRREADVRALAELAPEIPLTGIIVDTDMGPNLPPVRKATLAVYCDALDAVAGATCADVVVSPNAEVLREARRHGLATALWAEVNDDHTLRRVCADGRTESAVFVTLADQTNIPLELLIATFQKTGTKVIRHVRTANEAQVSFGTLESGCEGILVGAENTDLLTTIEHARRANSQVPIRLEHAIVHEVSSVGMGARVCVDTVEMLGPDDGMLVGSAAIGGLVVCAEVHPLPYMKLRPFRVNAGAVHSYIACPGGVTAYLSELVSGDKVLVVSTAGHARPVAVGRAKTERRPLLKITAEYGDDLVSAILQNDWHVRVFHADGQARSITTLRVGDQVLASFLRAPRHVGLALSEHLWES